MPPHGEGSEAIELTYFGEMESAELTLVSLVLWQLAAVVVTPSAMVAAGHGSVGHHVHGVIIWCCVFLAFWQVGPAIDRTSQKSA